MKNLFITVLLLSALLITGCNKDTDPPVIDSAYPIPDFYDFDNVNYDGQLQRLSMLLEMKAYLSSANNPGTVLDAVRLQAMYANQATDAGWDRPYDTSKQLRGKTLENQIPFFESLIDKIAAASQSTLAGSDGQAGVVPSNDGSKQYLLGPEGLEYAQLIEKGLMGACFYYQAMAVYFGDDRMNVDNEIVEPGEGTAMEHHWDEAFGYYGVPRDFPANTDGVVFWGTYSMRRDPLLESNRNMMKAFIKGRAAISNQDYEQRDEAIEEVRRHWELIAAGTAIHYLNTAIDNFDDMAIRAHALSEALAFTYSLQFNPSKRLSNQEVALILAAIGGDADFNKMNLYRITVLQLQDARDQLAGAFDLMSIKEQF